MSVDPPSIVVAVTAAAGALVHGLDVPAPIREPVTAALQTAEQTAAAIDQQVGSVVNQLPDPLQDQAQRSIADVEQGIGDALDPYVPNPPTSQEEHSVAPPAISPDDESDVHTAPSPPPTTAPVRESGPAQSSATGMLLPPIAAATPQVSLAPIGSIAVFIPWLTKAGSICDEVTPPILAALYSAENGFRFGPTSPVSPSGARGPGQFMPDTWAIYGKDADGDGKIDVNSVADSVMASGHLLCDIHAQIDGWKRRGVVQGDTLDLTIAGYNAGAGAVRASGGMPSGLPDYENQTKPYVARIRSSAPYFATLMNPFGALPFGSAGSEVARRAIAYLGLPYVWGGGGIGGPTGGGFDCSGLTSYAVFAATGVKLPRTSETQWNVGTEVPLEEARPGDLLFGNWQAGGPGHVAIYLGDGQMIHAPTTGDVVRIGSVFPNMKARRILEPGL